MQLSGILKYILLTVFILVFANYGIKLAINKLIYSQTCFSTQQVTSDVRCLYILNNKVFEKDTRNNPHKGHPCGMDVTSIIYSFHLGDVAKYLDPNYRGNICILPTITPLISPTAIPSLIPSLTPSIVSTPSVKSGDANSDGKVDGVDYIVWLSHYNQFSLNSYLDGDFNNSRIVDGVDYVIWLSNYNK